MPNIELLKSSLSFWEGFSYWCLLALVVVPVADWILEFTSWLESEAIKRKLSSGVAIVLIVAAMGEVLAHTRRAALTHEIFGILQEETNAANVKAAEAIERAAVANKLAEEAKERAAVANKLAEEAKERAGIAYESAAKANEQTAKVQVVAAELSLKNAERQKEIGALRKDISVREISDAQRDAFTDAIEGRKQIITLILPDDPEPRAYGDEVIKPLFQKAIFTVKIEDLKGSDKHTGIIVCENGGNEAKLFRALRKAKIPARLFRESSPNRPDYCSAPPFTPTPTMRVFVGYRVTARGR